ncbi:ATP-binding protein [Jannaschia sp. KMU-145]|uniref:PAS domain-containing sensor histidine kinase n=1 Tax=Jannaschia halovivens TaxID=3388667 RepID=UPI00396B3731
MTARQNPESQTWHVTPDLLGVLDADGKFMRTNPAWFATLGRTPEDIESRLFFDFIHPEDIARTAKAFVDIQHGRPILQFENRYRHKDGSYRWLSWNGVPEGDLFFCSARDVTEAKDNVTKLALREIEGKLREQFISILGHDLRNPLAGATCAVEYLRDRETLSDRGRTVIATADQSLRRMSTLIDDVLDFARARLGGDIGVDRRCGVVLRPVLAQTVAEIAMAHPDTVFEEEYAFTDPVACDPDRIAQLVSNLLGNAVFHGEPGGTVRIRAADDGDRLAVAITNHGGRIPAAVKAMLFQPFRRADPGNSPNGLGLGLYISKQIADGHEGDIAVDSDGTETTFTLRIPRDLTPAASDAPERLSA